MLLICLVIGVVKEVTSSKMGHEAARGEYLSLFCLYLHHSNAFQSISAGRHMWRKHIFLFCSHEVPLNTRSNWNKALSHFTTRLFQCFSTIHTSICHNIKTTCQILYCADTTSATKTAQTLQSMDPGEFEGQHWVNTVLIVVFLKLLLNKFCSVVGREVAATRRLPWMGVLSLQQC